MVIKIREKEIILDEARALYIPEYKILTISDLHVGKTAHFRRAGLQVPSTIVQTDLQRLGNLINKYHPATLLITGDLFHHGLNTDVDHFSSWRKQYEQVDFLLVKGNHDRLSEADYASMNINIYEPSFCLGPFCFIHDAPETNKNELYPISGHIHPGVSVIGKAKQRLNLPCFYFGNEYAVLPAFSAFTGLYKIRPKANDRIFAVTPGKVIEV